MARARVLRVIGWGERLLAALGLAGTFVVASGAGVVLHADLPLARQVVARAIGDALTGLLGGTVELSPFSHIGLTQVRLPRAALADEYGRRVLVLSDIRVDVSARVLAHDLIVQRDRLSLIIGHVRVEKSDVDLVRDPRTGEPTLVRAISPKRPTTVAAMATELPTGTRIYLQSVELGVVDLHARPENQPPIEARVRSVHGQLLGSPKGLAIDIDRFGVVVRRSGLDARGTGTLAIRAPGPLRGTFDGFVGDVELTARAFVDGSHVEAAVDVPGASPAAVAALVPGWPLSETASAHAEASGDVPELRVRGRLGAGPASVAARGTVTLGDAPRLTLDVMGRHLDVHAFVPAAPTTDVAASGTIAVRPEGAALAIDVRAHTQETRIDGHAVPAVDLSAVVSGGVVSGEVDVRDATTPLTASFEVSPEGTVDVDARSGTVRLEELSRLGVAGLRGSGKARVRAHLEKGAVRATVDADASSIVAPRVTLGSARVAASVSGRIDAPGALAGTARVEGSRLIVAGIPVDRFQVDGRGNRDAVTFVANASTRDGPDFSAAGTAVLGDRPRLRDTRLSLRKAPVSIEGRIEALDLEQGTVDVHDVRVTGAGGTVTGAVRLGPGLVEIDADGEGVDLDAVGRAIGLPRGILTGTMRLGAHLAAGKDVTRGRLRLGLGNTTLGPVGGVSMQVSADLDGTTVSGGVSGLVAGAGTFGATWEGTLAGSVLDAASFRGATGKADLQLGDLRIAALTMLLPKGGPVERVGGRAFARVLLERERKDSPLPNAFVTFSTRGLSADLPGAEGKPTTHVEGIELSGTGTFDGARGESTGTTIAADEHGTLLAATGTLAVDLPRFLSNPLLALQQIVDTPVDLVVSLPPRKLSELPAPVRPTGAEGGVAMDVKVQGTLAHPTLFASVDGRQMTFGEHVGRPVDLHADAQYAWTSRDVSVRATAALAGRPVATATFRGLVPEGPLAGWTGGGRLELAGLPFDLIGAVARSRMNGRLSGTATFSRSGASGTLGADLRIEDALVEHTALGKGRLGIVTDGPVTRATLTFEGDHGTVDATGSASVSWAGAFPAIARTSPIEAHLVAHDFPAIALSPLVQGVLTRVGGHLDADLGVKLEPAGSAEDTGWSGGIRGTAALRDGTVLIDTLGLELRDLTCSVGATGTGQATRLTIEGVRGRVRSTRDNVRGSAVLDLDGLRLASGTASLDADDTPILFRGVPQGRVTGHVDARLVRQGERMQVDLDVPRLSTVLPRASTREVIDLDENPDVTIVQSEPSSVGTESLPWRIAVHLGSEVTLRRSDVDLAVTGSPVLDLGRETSMSGSVELVPGGRVPVLGRVFSVEQGRVVFDTGDPRNPRVEVNAAWRAPTDITVYVQVTGTLRDAKIALRSDPPMTEPQVFALILGGGSSDPNTAADQNADSSGTAAGAAALNTGVSQLNQLVSNNPVELRVESTAQSLPRYTAAVRVRPNLWFEASEYQQSDYGVGSGSGRNVFSGTVDYRFTHRWSLRTEVGTAGGAMDLLWQYRY